MLKLLFLLLSPHNELLKSSYIKTKIRAHSFQSEFVQTAFNFFNNFFCSFLSGMSSRSCGTKKFKSRFKTDSKQCMQTSEIKFMNSTKITTLEHSLTGAVLLQTQKQKVF